MSATIDSPSTPRIAIIGAGLAGLTTSLFLHRLNLPITIYESRPYETLDGGYIALAPNAACVLDQLGLYQSLLTQGFAYEEYTFLSSRNCSHIASILNGSVKRYGYPALRISRHVLRRTLLDEAVKRGIDVCFEHKLVGIEEGSDGVALTFSNDTKTQPFDYMIAADGIHSRVRQLVFPSSPLPTYTGQTGIGGGQVPRSSIPSTIPMPCLILGPQNSFMVMPTTPSGDVLGISATLELPERTRAEWADLANDKTALKNMLIERHCDTATETSKWPKAVQDSCTSSDANSLAIWPFYNAPTLSSWLSPSNRIILLGDAAHAMPPTGGQGAAMAFEDAASLSLCLKSPSSNPAADISADLLAWQTRRMERVEKVKAFTGQGGDIRRATGGQLGMLLKEWVMWAVLKWRGPEGGFAWVYEYREVGVSEKEKEPYEVTGGV